MDRANGKQKRPHMCMQLIKEVEVVLQVRGAQQRMKGDIYVRVDVYAFVAIKTHAYIPTYIPTYM